MFNISKLTSTTKNSVLANIIKANKVLRRIKGNLLEINFLNLVKLDQLQVQF